MRISGWIGKLALIAATVYVCGCAHGTRDVRRVRTATPLARARAVGRANGQPDSGVMRTLVGRLADADPVVRLAAHEELRKRSGCDFRLCSVGKRRGTRRALATLAGLVGTGRYKSTTDGSVGRSAQSTPKGSAGREPTGTRPMNYRGGFSR